MQQFHGDLLIGGMALRDVVGFIDKEVQGAADCWFGHFRLEPSRRELLELNRNYLLMLDDGRVAKIIVTQMRDEDTRQDVVVEFNGATT